MKKISKLRMIEEQLDIVPINTDKELSFVEAQEMYMKYIDMTKEVYPEVWLRLDELYLKMSRIIADAEYIDEDTLDAESEAKLAPIEAEVHDLTNKLFIGGVR